MKYRMHGPDLRAPDVETGARPARDPHGVPLFSGSQRSDAADDFGALGGELIVGQQAIVVELVEPGEDIGR